MPKNQKAEASICPKIKKRMLVASVHACCRVVVAPLLRDVWMNCSSARGDEAVRRCQSLVSQCLHWQLQWPGPTLDLGAANLGSANLSCACALHGFQRFQRFQLPHPRANSVKCVTWILIHARTRRYPRVRLRVADHLCTRDGGLPAAYALGQDAQGKFAAHRTHPDVLECIQRPRMCGRVHVAR